MSCQETNTKENNVDVTCANRKSDKLKTLKTMNIIGPGKKSNDTLVKNPLKISKVMVENQKAGNRWAIG